MFACLKEQQQMSSLKTNSKNAFVVALTQHRVLGNIFIPMYVSTIADKIYTIAENLHGKKPEGFELSDIEQSILKVCNEYSDKVLASKFGKTQNTKEFIEKMDPAQFDEHIRPYIELRMAKVAKLLAAHQEIRLYFKDKKYNNVYEDNRIAVEPVEATPTFNFALSVDGLKYHIDAQVGDKSISLKGQHAEAITTSPSLVQVNGTLYRFDGIDSKKLTPFFTKPFITIATPTVRKYMETFVLNTIKSQVVKADGFDILEPKVSAQPVLTLELGLDGRASLSLKFSYDNRDFYSGSKTEPLVTFRADQKRFVFTKYERDAVTEAAVEKMLAAMGLLHYTGATYILPNNEEMEPQHSYFKTIEWLNDHADELAGRGVSVGQKVDGPPVYLGSSQSFLKAKSEATGFVVSGGVRFGKDFVSLAQLRKNVLKGQKLIDLESGRQAIIPQKWFKEYRQLLVFGRESSGSLQLQKQHFLLVEGLEGIDPTEIESLKQYASTSLTQSNEVKGISATLRDYQKIGLAWLKYLHLNSFGGCLADDMGLGKTLQTISLLQYCKDNFTYEREPAVKPAVPLDLFSSVNADAQESVVTSHPVSLIVLPTSLVHNWRNELRKFAPSIKIHEHLGATRAKSPSAFAPYDVVLTTYGTVRNDIDMLTKFKFFYLILDESQTVKNPDSATYKACLQIKTMYKLSLSGTPIENGLTDLWAQMNFLNKGLLGSLSLFKEQYVVPIEKYNHQGRQEKLKNLIEPFILRRTKEKVASELPAVTELEIYCEMTDKQRDLYDEEKELARQKMLSEIKEGNAKRSRFVFLQLLTRLRQIANHPSLAGYEGYDCASGKFDEITRNIESVVNEGHKLLIFSSFVQHLNLVARHLDDVGIQYSMLTGSTLNRQQVINEFKHKNDVKAFLISLKAGGVGLNLTEADYVFILDPWWNPAAENQAISRSHRIGQENKVFAYRFITSDSIEQRILELQRQKSELADIFVNSNNPLSKISEEVLLQLF